MTVSVQDKTKGLPGTLFGGQEPLQGVREEGRPTDLATLTGLDGSRGSSAFEIPPEHSGPSWHRFAPYRPNLTSALRGVPVGVWRFTDVIVSAFLLVGVVTLKDGRAFPASLDALLTQLGPQRLLVVSLFLLVWAGLLSSLNLYDERRLAGGGDQWRLVGASILGSVAVALLPLTWLGGRLGAGFGLIFGMAATMAIGGIRFGSRALLGTRRLSGVRNVVIVGSGPRASAIHRELSQQGGSFYNVLGFVDDAVENPPSTHGMPRLGGLEQLESIVEHQVVDEVRIALPVKSRYNSFQAAIGVCERTGVEFSYPLDTFNHRLTRPRISQSHGRVSVTTHPVLYDDNLELKRALDLVIATGMGLAFLPAILGIAVVIRLTSPGPVFFSQQRYGKNKRLFRMYKFRTMCTDAERALQGDPALYAKYSENNFKLPIECDPRVTRIGRLLRKSSLDELPQLWNVLRGDMSLVGPRPIVPAELSMYGSASSLLLALKPGCTGVWVVEGRSRVSYPRRAELELQYVRNWSLLEDLSILLRSVKVVFRGDGAH